MEARAIARVRHPAIVPIHDIMFAGDDPWIVMDYISGRSLEEIIRDEPHRLQERSIAAIGLATLQGLRAVHAAGVVHRDVKPANILVAENGSVHLVDFGIAKIAGGAALTGSSRVPGTAEFMAPERIRGQAAGPAADLWSLGATLYSALEGHSPFLREGERGVDATIAAILHEDPPEPASRGQLAEVVLKLLRKDPAERPDAAAVAGVLEAITGSRPSADRAETPLTGMPMADAVEFVSRSSTDAGVAMMLGMPQERAAGILSRCPARVAAGLLQGMADTDPVIAGTILQIFTARQAGQVLAYVRPSATALILASMPAGEAVRILRESGVRTSAGALSEMPAAVSAGLLRAMPEERAADVLGHLRPARAAAMLTAVSGDLSGRLLRRLSPALRDLVTRDM
jgi:flagellar motility protein MotE (MotC chaperone)